MEIVQFLVSKNAFKQAQQNMGFKIFCFNGEKRRRVKKMFFI